MVSLTGSISMSCHLLVLGRMDQKLRYHFASLDSDKDIVEENIVSSLLSVLGYTAQTLELHPDKIDKMIKYLRSERCRLLLVSQETRYPLRARDEGSIVLSSETT